MSSRPDPRAASPPAAESAGQVELLLRAEQNAEDDVARAEDAARRTLEAAREQARRIASRADERITALSARASESVERRIEIMRRDSEARGAARRRPLAEASHIEAAARRVVDWLLGDDETCASPEAGR